MVFGVIQFFNEENADCRLFGKHASRFDARLQKVELSNWFENYVDIYKLHDAFTNLKLDLILLSLSYRVY